MAAENAPQRNGAPKLHFAPSACDDFLIFGFRATVDRRSTAWRTSVPALFYANLATWPLQAVGEKI
jgi:hypothetical protein